jgi:hypothetical protein
MKSKMDSKISNFDVTVLPIITPFGEASKSIGTLSQVIFFVKEFFAMEQRHKNALRRIFDFLLKAVVEAVIQAIVHILLG